MIDKKTREKRFILVILWILSLGFLWFHIFVNPFVKMTEFQRLTYASVERELFSFSICWIIFACHRLKSGGIIRYFLSSTVWQPLSRLSLSIYLLHLIFVKYTMDWYRIEFGFMWLMHIHVGDIVVSTLLAALAFILIEAPTSQIMENFLNSRTSSIQRQECHHEERENLLQIRKSYKTKAVIPVFQKRYPKN
jgi:peptidoglycan/LPS O-acetylase OafA/YrhL